jgi:2-keto-3-deoxy-L-fuconate dehydrogenase
MMGGRLEGRTAFCTASGAGIGRATAIAFAREGARVIASDIDMAALRDLGDHGIAETHLLDVTSTAAVERTAKEIGPVDILFNAAGFVHNGTVLTCSEEDWDFSFDLNVKSMHRTIKAFLPGMLDNDGGAIVNIASVSGSVLGVPNRYAYGATKAAVIGLTKAVAADFMKQGIRANAICPGTVQSPSLEQRIADQARATNQSIDAVRQAFVDRQPMGRLGQPEEIALAAVYLASDESAFVTGTAFLIEGGFAL